MNRQYQKLAAIFRSFDAGTQTVVMALTVLLVIGVLGIAGILNHRILVAAAAPGGSLVEGVIGAPRFINPILAVSDADRDLALLVYSGLMRVGSDSKLIPDLAESYQISADGMTYTFILKDNLKWHDGKPLTTDDIEFTVLRVQDPQIKSGRRAGWEGVRVERINQREIRFHLKQPYATFLDTTTMGILPKHRWREISADTFALNELNLNGIGSGPYKIKTIRRDGEGVPRYYEFEPFSQFALGRPKLNSLIIRFYPSDTDLLAAFKRGEVESIAAIPPDIAQELTKTGARVEQATLPRVFAVFFNQNEAPLFTNREVRQALNLATPRQKIIDQVLKGYGQAINGPLPPEVSGYEPLIDGADDQLAAAALLEQAGWAKNETGVWEKKTKSSSSKLTLKLTTASTPELKAAAELIAAEWRTLGAEVTLEVFEMGDLNQNVIRPRKYEALFFGEILGANPDPFAFWHSSQRLDPGLNIALYTNLTADKLLTEIRSITDNQIRADKLAAFAAEIKTDVPAVFVYSPAFIYVLPDRIKGLALSGLTTPADRFSNVYEWYINTEKVWPIFANRSLD